MDQEIKIEKEKMVKISFTLNEEGFDKLRAELKHICIENKNLDLEMLNWIYFRIQDP